MSGRSVLVTGCAGFIGRAVCDHLAGARHVRGTTRADVGDIGPDTDWTTALRDMDCVVHLAARAHNLDDQSTDPLTDFRRVNTAGTVAIARQAVSAGVRRMVFISSIGVNGAETHGRPYTAADVPAPHSPYAVSKHEAEIALRDITAKSGLEVVVIRPPLVIGPGAPGNFARLLAAVNGGIPMPFASIDNRRSFVTLTNLVHLIGTCLDHPAASGQTFLVSDGEDLSTPELLRRVGRALGKPPRLLPFPPGLLRLGAGMLGKGELAQRLAGSLQVDIGPTRRALGWTPPWTVDEEMRRVADRFREGGPRA